jgi:hypothetical protein
VFRVRLLAFQPEFRKRIWCKGKDECLKQSSPDRNGASISGKLGRDSHATRFFDIILRVIGRQGAAVLVRVMGIILASLAVEIVLTALAVGDWGPLAPR